MSQMIATGYWSWCSEEPHFWPPFSGCTEEVSMSRSRSSGDAE